MLLAQPQTVDTFFDFENVTAEGSEFIEEDHTFYSGKGPSRLLPVTPGCESPEVTCYRRMELKS